MSFCLTLHFSKLILNVKNMLIIILHKYNLDETEQIRKTSVNNLLMFVKINFKLS